MILKKPYAFLIKNFKLIHLIITAVLGYLVFYHRTVYKYLNLCIKDQVNRYNALEYINYSIYIFIGIVIILFFVIHWLLKYKDKPRKIYIFSIVGYVIVGIFMFVVYGYLCGFPNDVIDQKTIRLYRDILSMTLIFQYLIIVIMFIRGLGFDIKKFNFSKDFQELDIAVDDSEEVEVNVLVDTTSVMRGVRKKKREFGYFYKEYKIYILSILIVLIGILGFKGYKYFNVKYKVYNENEYFGSSNYIKITDSYYSKKDNKNYIIVKFDIYKYGVQEKLNTSNVILSIGKKTYIPDKNICYNFSDIGICYKKQYISETEKNYILVYEVPKEEIDKSYIIYQEVYGNPCKVELDLEEY